MRNEEIAVFLMHLEEDCYNGRIEFWKLIMEFSDWLRTSGQCKDFRKFYSDYKKLLSE